MNINTIRNSNIDVFENELKNIGVDLFSGIYPPAIEDDNTIHFIDHSQFLAFVKNEKIKSIFLFSSEITIDDYYITDDVIEESLGEYESKQLSQIVLDEIDNYNISIEQYGKEINGLKRNFYFAAYNGFIVLAEISDKILFTDPTEQLQKILVGTQDNVKKEKEQNRLVIEILKEKLKQKILEDPNFLKATNQRLRRVYIYNVLKELGMEYELLQKHWLNKFSEGVYMGARDFIEELWKEYKERKS